MIMISTPASANVKQCQTFVTFAFAALSDMIIPRLPNPLVRLINVARFAAEADLCRPFGEGRFLDRVSSGLQNGRKWLNWVMFEELLRVVRTLRKRCPWDRRQTLSSSRPLVLNEAFELDEALRKRDTRAIAEELGDYLFMGLFIGQVLEETRGVRLQKVLKGVVQKLKARHPHVYGDVKVKGVDEVLANWERIKRRGQRGSILDGLPRALPALQQAQLIQERCRRVGFDWASAPEVLRKVEEEIGELRAELKGRRSGVKEELGDLLFAVVNLCRHLGVDAEGALKDANEKFRRRFGRIEQEFARQGRPLSQVSLEEMELVWQRTKRGQRRKRRPG